MTGKMNWPKVNAEARYARGLREEESGLVAPKGDNRPESKKSGYSHDEKKWMKDAEKIVAGYTDKDGWIKYLKRELQGKGLPAVTTPRTALAVFRIVKGIQKPRRPRNLSRRSTKPKPAESTSPPSGSSGTIRSSGRPGRRPTTDQPVAEDLGLTAASS
jgi:hypothetical protein